MSAYLLSRRPLEPRLEPVDHNNLAAGDRLERGFRRRPRNVISARAARALLSELGVSARVDGPISPDTIFVAAMEGAFDAVVALYHDQGLIPVKLLDFHDTVNMTLGLPFVRTSPDHGVAYDLVVLSLGEYTMLDGGRRRLVSAARHVVVVGCPDDPRVAVAYRDLKLAGASAVTVIAPVSRRIEAAA